MMQRLSRNSGTIFKRSRCFFYSPAYFSAAPVFRGELPCFPGNLSVSASLFWTAF